MALMDETLGSAQSTGEGEWFREAFDRLYPLIYRHRDDASASREVEGLLDVLELRGDERVLDAACGNGRHLVAILGRGLDGFGFDLSPVLIARAGRRTELAGRVVRADIRRVPFRPAFDLVVNLFTSFGYFASEAENLDALRQLAGCLRPGGRLVIDHVNRRHLERNLTPEDTRQIDGLVLRNRRRIENDRIVKRTTVTHRDGTTDELVESVRLYEPEAFAALFEAAGLDVDRMMGGYDGEPLAEDRPRLIVIGSRA